MSRTPRWVRPTIATASLVAVGAASVILGASFAPAPAAEPAAPEPHATQAFPVLQPAGYGETWGSREDVDENSLSYEQGMREVRVDDLGVPTPGADIEDAAEVLSESPDPVIDDWDLAIVGEDDPCAPADGSDVEGCPDGIRGATFSLSSPGELWARFRAEPSAERTNPYELVFCPTAETGATALRYGIVTTAPGAIELRYWPRTDPSRVTTITLSSTPEQVAAWEAGLTSGSAGDDATNVQHCGILDGLQRHVSYNGEVVVRDVLGREARSDIVTPFGLPDDRTAPPFRVTPLGENAILASAPHRENTEVRFNVQVLDPGDRDDCSTTDDQLPLVDQAVGATTVDVSAEYLADHGYQSQYTKRTSIAVYVPAGATVLVCAGVYEPDRPGWQWLDAQYRYTMVLQTPDTPRPVITVGAVDLEPGYESADVSLTARWSDTGEHLACTLWSPTTVAGSPCGGNPHDVTRGDVWVTASARLDGDWTRWSSLLPLGSIDCYDGCMTPDTAWYTVPVKVQERPGETCGSGIIGPCPETTIGTAILRVDWMPGARGDDAWVFSPPTAGAVEHELAPLPQMDWLVTPEVVTGSSPRDPMVRFTLKADRPSDYVARLLGDCERPSAVFEQSGSVTTVGTSVVFTGACAGERYTLQVQLTDADGNTNVFGGLGGLPWPDSRIVVPGLEYDVVMGQHLALKHSADQMKVREFRVRVDEQSIAPRLPENNCVYRHDLNTPPSATLEGARLGEVVTVEITVQLAEAFGSTEGTRAFCNAGVDGSTLVYRMSVEVPLDDLLTGVTIAAPEHAPYVTEVTLRLVNR